MNISTHMKRSVAAIAIAVASIAAMANAEDVVRLRNGQELRGEIVRELAGSVWIKVEGSLGEPRFITASEIESIIRDAGNPPPVKPTPAAEPASPRAEPLAAPKRDASAPRTDATASKPFARRAAVLTLGEGGSKDMVGMYMTAHPLREAIPLLEKENIDTVVFRINSGGGALLEIQRLSDVIQEEYKPRFTVVAWIESAISAAAMTAHVIEDIYFTPEGNYGACTGWSGQLQAVEGRDLEEVVYMMEKISARGKKAPEIMKAMQHFKYPLSCDIDENGEVKWYQDETGEFVVNPEGRILTFDSQEALRYRFSKGTADTLDELERAMGLTEVEWVGEHVKGIPWPVCRAERLQMEYRNKVAEDEERLNEYWYEYQAAVEIAQAQQDRQTRGKFVNKAREGLYKIRDMVKNNPNFTLFVFGMLEKDFWDWFQQQEDLLRDLMR